MTTTTTSAGHEIADPDAPAFDTCRYRTLPVILRDGRLVTMLGDNAECYGARPC